MSPHQVYCSTCGSPQLLCTTSKPFVLRCRDCQAVTVGMGNSWENPPEIAAVFLPLPPVISYDELDFICGDCDATLSLEVVVRSPHPPCKRCAGLDRLTIQESVQIPSASLLTNDELAFLGQISS